VGADVSTGWSAMLVALAGVGLETWAALVALALTVLGGCGIRIYSERQRTTRYRLALQDVPPKNRADVVRALEGLPEGTAGRPPSRRRGGR
jgi:hypothetical protein